MITIKDLVSVIHSTLVKNNQSALADMIDNVISKNTLLDDNINDYDVSKLDLWKNILKKIKEEEGKKSEVKY